MLESDYQGLILASQSPRRRELLTMAGIPFRTANSDCDEDGLMDQIRQELPAMAENDLVERLAAAKARAVLARYPQALVLAADTLVSLDGVIFGKPADKAQARLMLRQLAGRTHLVDTGVALLSQKGEEIFSSRSKVCFRPLTKSMEALIDRYVETGLPLDKAGAYGIQELGGLLIQSIEGDFFSVMGLPVAEVYERLQAYDIQA